METELTTTKIKWLSHKWSARVSITDAVPSPSTRRQRNHTEIISTDGRSSGCSVCFFLSCPLKGIRTCSDINEEMFVSFISFFVCVLELWTVDTWQLLTLAMFQLMSLPAASVGWFVLHLHQAHVWRPFHFLCHSFGQVFHYVSERKQITSYDCSLWRCDFFFSLCLWAWAGLCPALPRPKDTKEKNQNKTKAFPNLGSEGAAPKKNDIKSQFSVITHYITAWRSWFLSMHSCCHWPRINTLIITGGEICLCQCVSVYTPLIRDALGGVPMPLTLIIDMWTIKMAIYY